MIDIDLIKNIRHMKFEEHFSNAEISEKLQLNIRMVKRVTCKNYDAILTRKEEKAKEYDKIVEMVKKCLPYSNSINHLCNMLGLKGVEAYYNKISKIIFENKLSTEHFGTINLRTTCVGRNKYTAMSDDEFFINGSRRGGSIIMNRLIKGGYKEYKCECCSISEWNGKAITLQVHHINGVHNDNRLANLQILCPNCHTQTDNYSNKGNRRKAKEIDKEKLQTTIDNIKKIKIIQEQQKPSYCQYCGKKIIGNGTKFCSYRCAKNASKKFEISPDQLIKDFQEIKTYTGVGKKYGVSDNAVKKRCKRLGIYEKISKYITHR